MKNRHFTHFNLAGFTYWEGPLVFSELKIGTELTLQREADNAFDAYAVAIYYQDSKIGFVPRGENKEFAKFCEMGYADIFDVRINRVSSEFCPEEQIGVVVYLKPR